MTAKKKVVKKVTKKVAKKKVAKKASKVEAQEAKMAEEQKAQEAQINKHMKKTEVVGKALDKLAKKHGIKMIVQAYDVENEVPFLQAFEVNSDFEAKAMVGYTKESLRL